MHVIRLFESAASHAFLGLVDRTGRGTHWLLYVIMTMFPQKLEEAVVYQGGSLYTCNDLVFSCTFCRQDKYDKNLEEMIRLAELTHQHGGVQPCLQTKITALVSADTLVHWFYYFILGNLELCNHLCRWMGMPMNRDTTHKITKRFMSWSAFFCLGIHMSKMFSYHFLYSCHWNNGFKRTTESGDKLTATQHDTVYQTTEEINTSSAILMEWYHFIHSDWMVI
jgi:hypothetical protein